jgi:DNA-3-methyladenine glycosylase
VTSERPLPRQFFARDSRHVARDLLNKIVVVGDRAARIVEVEAYLGGEDPASHAFKGETARNRTMFGPAGHLYVYFTYGMHWCANAVCGEEGTATAVLLRAGSPLRGIDDMWAARPAARRLTDLCSGPAKLCQALGITGDDDGVDLTRPHGRIAITDDGMAPPTRPGLSTRIGLSRGIDHPWRWYVPGDPHVSRP